MAAILTSLQNTVIAGLVLAAILFALAIGSFGVGVDQAFWAFVFRWFHVLSGVMWIGLLWYFNFVQIPNMPNIPDEQKPAIGKVIAPSALFWFRWGAMATIVTGIILAHLNGYLVDALTLSLAGGSDMPAALEGAGKMMSEAGAAAGMDSGIFDGIVEKNFVIGIGMWLGTIMWFNVWFIIWPNQQKALNIKNKYPDIDADSKAAAARRAMLFSRTNTLLSIPMLFCMVAAQNLF